MLYISYHVHTIVLACLKKEQNLELKDMDGCAPKTNTT